MIIRMHGEAQGQLAKIAVAPNRFALLLRSSERRQQHSRENGDDCDDDEQFAQRKRRLGWTRWFHSSVNGDSEPSQLCNSERRAISLAPH